jgi:hypothetical protein
MKKIILFILLGVGFVNISCTDSFLDRYPKGTWNRSNYKASDSLNVSILAEAKLSQCYSTLRGWPFLWSAFGMNNYTTPDVEKGSTPSDGGEISQFKSMSFTPGSANIKDYYSGCYSTIYLSNEAIALIHSLSDTVVKKNNYLAEALFLRSVMYYRLNQAFGGVPWVDKVLSQTDKTPARSTRDEIWTNIEKDLSWSIQYLYTRKDLLATGNSGKATQNAARAVLAKVYLYQKNWANAFAQTQAIINSGDNDLSTPYDQIFTEANEYGPESVFEVYCDQKPALQIYLGSQFDQIQGFRGTPNLGWGFNSPSQVLINSYESGDPRKAASVIHDGDIIDGQTFKADAASYKYFNKKALTRPSERTAYGRASGDQGNWVNIRLIRYADVLLMHAEAACELGNTTEALDKLEMVRARARGGNNTVLPKITTTDQIQLRRVIHQERRIELAMEWERFYDLVRWDEAKDVIPGFIVGKNELFPIPQIEIDKSNGVLTQNPGY